MRRIGLVTTSRADFGIYVPILRAIEAHPRLELNLIVSGMHLAEDFGRTEKMIEAAGFAIAHRVESLAPGDDEQATVQSMGLGLTGFGELFARFRPDILVVLGDRFEMHAAALAALPYRLPVAHIHGGELTLGAMDDALRHSMTKLSHLHFPATAEYGQRIIQLGEEPWRVVVTGAPALDNLKSIELLSAAELETSLGIELSEPPLLVTYHPVTLDPDRAGKQIDNLLTVLRESGRAVVFTLPNADPGHRIIRDRIANFVANHDKAWVTNNLGTQKYFSMMALAAAMVGNSSSGIIEAASFELPVVNIGSRQKGRLRAGNVIDTPPEAEDILVAINRATAEDFRQNLAGLVNPYGDGRASERIVNHLASVELGAKLIIKRFHDLTQSGGRG